MFKVGLTGGIDAHAIEDHVAEEAHVAGVEETLAAVANEEGRGLDAGAETASLGAIFGVGPTTEARQPQEGNR